MTNEKAIELLKTARCAFHSEEMAKAFEMAIEAVEAEPCVNCRKRIAEHICYDDEKHKAWNAGYSDGYHRAMVDYGLEGDVEPNIDEAVRCLQVLIDQHNMESEKAEKDCDIYIDENGGRYYYLSIKDFKAIRTAITILLAVGKNIAGFDMAEIDKKWYAVIGAACALKEEQER